MKYKTFSGLLITSTVTLFGIIGAFNYIIDPYGYNNRFKLSVNSHKAVQDERIYKYELIEANPHAKTFIFGSSRGLNLNPELVSSLTNESTINCAFSSASADEYYLYIKYLIETRKVKRIIIGIDLFAYADGFSSSGTLPEPLMDYFHLNENRSLSVYLNAEITKKAFKTIRYNLKNQKHDLSKYTDYGQVIPYGLLNAMKNKQEHDTFIQEHVVKKSPRWDTRFDILSKTRLNNLKEIKKLCDSKKIKLDLFMSPLYIKQITMKGNKFFLQKQLLRYIVQNIQPIWDYNAISPINTDPYAYEDEFHYNYLTGKSVINEILTGKPSIKKYSGIYVTNAILNEYLDDVDEKFKNLKIQ
jgi:hypothetical protein